MLPNRSIIIKPAGIDDIPVIQSLSEKIWFPTYVPIIGTEQVLYMLRLFYSEAAMRKQIEVQNQKFVLAYLNGVPVAFASFSETKNGACKLHKLYTLPEYQGRGCARALLGNIISSAKSLGASSLYLNVNRHNTHAIKFYEQFGFSRTGEEDIDIGNGYFMNDYIYSLKLSHE